MPIKIPKGFPATSFLKNQNIEVIDFEKAENQEIRPLNLLIINIMPTKIQTEMQLLRLLGISSLQIDVDFLYMSTHKTKNVDENHLFNFYKDFDKVRKNRYDGMILTGAPVEQLDFEEVDYFEELKEIFEWSKKHVFSTMSLCWGAQVDLYLNYGIDKIVTKEKFFGVFPYSFKSDHYLSIGLDDIVYVPQSRYSTINEEQVRNNNKLEVICESKDYGINAISCKCGRKIFLLGHSEYNRETLDEEYRNQKVSIPKNYYIDNDPNNKPLMRWQSSAHLIFKNWLNFIYQETYYDLNQLENNPLVLS